MSLEMLYQCLVNHLDIRFKMRRVFFGQDIKSKTIQVKLNSIIPSKFFKYNPKVTKEIFM